MKQLIESMTWKRFILFLSLLLIFVLSVALLMRIQRPNTITFVFTGDTQGYLVPCGCKVTPSGGLPRRAGYINKMRQDRPGDWIVPVEVTGAFSDRGPGKDLLNREMARFLFQRGYGVVGLSLLDLSMGKEYIEGLGQKLPFCLAGSKDFPASVEYRLGGWGVGPIGDRGDRMRVIVLAESAPGETALPDPAEVLKAEMKKSPDTKWVVVGKLSPKKAADIIKGNEDILGMVLVWGGTITSAPQKVEKKWAIYLGDRGRRVCTLEITKYPDSWSLWPETQYLSSEVQDEAATEKEVQDVLAKVTDANRKALGAMTTKGMPGATYMGAAHCKRCHEDAHKKWASSQHAKATARLAVDHQQENPECLKCHATGTGKGGGYPQPGVELAGVQCEACHGPGDGHPGRKMPVPKADKDGCGGCHTDRDSPGFVPESSWRLIEHR